MENATNKAGYSIQSGSQARHYKSHEETSAPVLDHNRLNSPLWMAAEGGLSRVERKSLGVGSVEEVGEGLSIG